MLNLKKENRNICSGCTACVACCPVNCITMKRDKMGFLYPEVDETRCVHCDACDKVCAQMKNKYSDDNADVKGYAVVSADNDTRRVSSSGGLFSLLAQRVISQNGVVFGAAFSDDFKRVEHIEVDCADSLSRLQGSKYVQSEIGLSYTAVRDYLEQGRQVLFSGTPCQAAGLSAFLKKDYDNLLLVDIVCHGVPAPDVWSEYLSSLEQKYCGKTTAVSFRDKRYGWSNYVLGIGFDNGKEYVKNRADDLFMRGFLHDYYLRPSCYSCDYKGLKRVADITLGDLWGADKLCPELDDNKGTSLAIVSTAKGEKVLNELMSGISCRAIDISEAIKFNPAIVKAAGDRAERVSFEQQFKSCPTDALLDKFCSQPIHKKIIKKLKSFLK